MGGQEGGKSKGQEGKNQRGESRTRERESMLMTPVFQFSLLREVADVRLSYLDFYTENELII